LIGYGLKQKNGWEIALKFGNRVAKIFAALIQSSFFYKAHLWKKKI